jgi:cytochrome c553
MTSSLHLRRALPALAAALIAATTFSSQAQTAPDPVAGRALFENTPAASGNAGITATCASCHSSVQERRAQIGGNAYAEISLSLATNRVGQAIANQASMRQFQTLTQKQVEDLAAYIADTPETSTDQLNFTATALNTATAAQFVELRHAKATTETLRVVSVAITGSNAARFTRTADTCDQQTLPAGGSCRVTVSYSAPDTMGSIVPLTFTLRQGTSTTSFTRTMFLNGAVSVTSTPTPTPGGGSADEGGGGAMSLGWLAAMALATALLWLASRKAPSHQPCPTGRGRHAAQLRRQLD